MISRRRFLTAGSASIAMSALGINRARARFAYEGPLGLPVGLQIWSVREDFAKDLPGTLRRIADIGYREVEFAGIPPMPAPQIAALLKDCGLAAPSMHASMADLQSGLAQRLDYAKAVGAQYLVCAFPSTADQRFANAPGGAFTAGITLDDWYWNADQLNRIGEAANRVGLRCGYHNHNMEFRRYGDMLGYDALLSRTSASHVTMELDVGWVVTAGLDPLRLLHDHRDRISMLHIKDERKDAKVVVDRIESRSTELGRGKMDWAHFFANVPAGMIRHNFVEQEDFEVPPLEAAKMNFEFLHGLSVARAT